jgi:hypothetical protein
MASTITITCPECDKQIKAPPEVVGKKIRCKSCGHAFVAKADRPPPAGGKPAKPGAKAPAKVKPAKPEAEDEGDANPYGVTNLDLAPRCPECANEMESETAVICLYCGYNTETRERARTRKVRDVTGGDRFAWLLPGILCVLLTLFLLSWGITTVVNYFTIDWAARFGENAKYAKQGGACCAIWWNVLMIWGAYKAGRFAVKRLIQHPTPPDREED